jgi:hypothetical protein
MENIVVVNNEVPQTDPVIWQWHQLALKLREYIVELSGFNPKIIKQLPKKDAVEIETWIQCILNQTMRFISQGEVDLRFDTEEKLSNL